MKTATDYEAEIKRIPQDAEAMEEQDYQANVKAGMEILTEDTWRSRTKLAFRCGIAEGVAQTLLSYARYLESELEQRTLKNRDLPALLLGFLFDRYPEAEDDTDLQDVKRWLAEAGYGSPQAPSFVAVGRGEKYPGEER
jgi:hypothetical protein